MTAVAALAPDTELTYREAMDFAGKIALARVWKLADLLKKVLHVPGDIVECGTWRGGAAIALAVTAPHKTIYGFDTFQGCPEVTEYDQHMLGDFRTSLKEARDYTTPFKNITLVPGNMKETVPKFTPRPISFLFVDCDLYESHKVVFQHLLPMVSPGGLIVLDDYNVGENAEVSDCKGAIKAILETFKPEEIKLYEDEGFFVVRK